MKDNELRRRLLGITALASEYCITVENASEMERNEFMVKILNLLPKIYVEFLDLVPGSEKKCHCGAGHHHDEECDCEEDCHCHHENSPEEIDEFAPVSLEEEDMAEYFPEYVDEDYYNNVRHHIGSLLGPDDVYLETFEEDMKYSDTPIAASISESLADIFQPLYNFISVVKDSEGENLVAAYKVCHENFMEYWSQTLCNVLRALNHVYFNN